MTAYRELRRASHIRTPSVETEQDASHLNVWSYFRGPLQNIANYRPFSLYVAHHGSRIIGECGEHWRQVADIRFAHPEENNTGNMYSRDGGLNIVAVGRPARSSPLSDPTAEAGPSAEQQAR